MENRPSKNVFKDTLAFQHILYMICVFYRCSYIHSFSLILAMSSSKSSSNSSYTTNRDKVFNVLMSRAAVSSPKTAQVVVQLATTSKPLYNTIKKLSPNDGLKDNIKTLKSIINPTKIWFGHYQRRSNSIVMKEKNIESFTNERIRAAIEKYLNRPRSAVEDVHSSEIFYQNADGSIAVRATYNTYFEIILDGNTTKAVKVVVDLASKTRSIPVNAPWDDRFTIALRWIETFHPINLKTLRYLLIVKNGKVFYTHGHASGHMTLNAVYKANAQSWTDNIRSMYEKRKTIA